MARLHLVSLRHGERAVVVAVVAVRMVEVPVDQVVRVVVMRDGFVSAPVSVRMGPVVTVTHVGRSAVGGVRFVDGDDVFVHMITMRVVKMAVMKVVRVTLMRDGQMTAGRTVDVVVVGVGAVIVHESSLSGVSRRAKPMGIRSLLTRRRGTGTNGVGESRRSNSRTDRGRRRRTPLAATLRRSLSTTSVLEKVPFVWSILRPIGG